MVEFSDDPEETLTPSKSGQGMMKMKSKKEMARRQQQEFEEHIDDLRSKKIHELENIRRKEALKRKQQAEEKRNKMLAGGSGGSGITKFTNVNCDKLPAMAPSTVKPTVHAEYTSVNPAMELKKKKKAKQIYGQGSNPDLHAAADGDRPASARSGMTAITGGMTAAMT